MRAAEISIHPKFDLMKQSDILSFYHMQMPRWLFAHSKYKTISLEAKVAYTFLLNRFQLSKMNGWVNADNEVFVIFTRESLADEMGVSYKKAIACFKELVGASLIWEQRLGRGSANQIYLASVELAEEDANKTNTAPFIDNANADLRPAKTTHQESEDNVENSADSDCLSKQDLPNLQDKTCDNSTSRTAISAYPDMPKLHSNNIKSSYTDFSNIDISQSFAAGKGLTGVSFGSLTLPEYALRKTTIACGANNKTNQTYGLDLQNILNNCELEVLPTEIASTFKNAIERLYYATSFCIDGIPLPREKVHSDLSRLEGSIVMEAYRKLKRNTDKVIKNSTTYLMAVIYNCIFEIESDLLVDPNINSMLMQFGGERPCY